MALLLKIDPADFSYSRTNVSKQKSAKDIGTADEGSEVFVWFTNAGNSRSQLSEKCTFISVEGCDIPQKRNPHKTVSAYRLQLEPIEENIPQPLSTDDLASARYDSASPEFAGLGKLHRDRNSKIIRLSAQEAKILNDRFDR